MFSPELHKMLRDATEQQCRDWEAARKLRWRRATHEERAAEIQRRRDWIKTIQAGIRELEEMQ